MSETIAIPAGERGVVRVFAVHLDGTAAEAFESDMDALAGALGVARIDPTYADVFPVRRLADLGLSTYLAEGHGIPEHRLVTDRPKLDAMTGHVAVLSSEAFGGEGVTLTVVPPLHLVGTYAEDRTGVSFDRLPSGGAKGGLDAGVAAPPPPLRGGKAGKVIAILVLVAAFLAMAFLGGNR